MCVCAKKGKEDRWKRERGEAAAVVDGPRVRAAADVGYRTEIFADAFWESQPVDGETVIGSAGQRLGKRG